MKRLFCIVGMLILNSCYNRTNYENAIVGIWEIDSVLNYENGMESMIRIAEENKIYVGSLEYPKTFNYTNHNELFLIDPANNNNQYTTYKVLVDSIIHEKTYFNSKILRLDEKNLIFVNEVETIWFDSLDHPKQIITYYLSKKE